MPHVKRRQAISDLPWNDTMHTRDMIAPAAEMMTAGAPSWLTRCVDQWATQAAYEELSRLADARLEQQGLCRDRLARTLRE
jgi:hypothetical protein